SAGSAFTSGEATVINTAPVITAVTLSEICPKTNDTLSVRSDERRDGEDDAVSYTYQWQKKAPADSGFSDLSGRTNATLDLSGTDNDSKGDKLRVAVTPPADSSAGSAFTSGEATVINTAPVISAVTLNTTSPKTNDTLSV